MIVNLTLPDPDQLVKAVCDSLDDITRVDDRLRGNWTNAICNSIKLRLQSISAEIGVAFGRDRSKPEDEREFLFDFTAFVGEQEPDHPDWYTMQAVVVGEIEFHGNLGRDFEKLMFVDSLVVFFVFPEWIKEHRPESEIDFFTKVAERRIQHVSSRGSTPAPVFIIGSYSPEHRRFTKRIIRNKIDSSMGGSTTSGPPT